MSPKQPGQEIPPLQSPPVIKPVGSPLYFGAFIIVAVLGFGLISWANYEFAKEADVTSNIVIVRPQEKVKLQLEYGNTKRAFVGPVSVGMTVASALTKVDAAYDFHLSIKNGAVIALAGKESGDSGIWRIYVNGNVNSEVLSYQVHAGDKVVLRYE